MVSYFQLPNREDGGGQVGGWVVCSFRVEVLD
jgi:hypothetical protein